jgi:RimJ/RimL family protein N-acetyltransferase
MNLNDCEFETERLFVKEWHSLSPSDWKQEEIAEVVSAMLTEPVTRSLPSSWQGEYSTDRAREWIRERDEEGTTFLIIDRTSRRWVGLMILSGMQGQGSSVEAEVRLGYLLSEATWGKGIASELVSGFVTWCLGQESITSIAAGVAHDNLASKRVLEKNGFKPDGSDDEVAESEELFRLKLS